MLANGSPASRLKTISSFCSSVSFPVGFHFAGGTFISFTILWMAGSLTL